MAAIESSFYIKLEKKWFFRPAYFCMAIVVMVRLASPKSAAKFLANHCVKYTLKDK